MTVTRVYLRIHKVLLYDSSSAPIYINEYIYLGYKLVSITLICIIMFMLFALQFPIAHALTTQTRCLSAAGSPVSMSCYQCYGTFSHKPEMPARQHANTETGAKTESVIKTYKIKTEKKLKQKWKQNKNKPKQSTAQRPKHFRSRRRCRRSV